MSASDDGIPGDIDCPYPFIAPFAKNGENLTLENCELWDFSILELMIDWVIDDGLGTELVATIWDPDLLIAQVCFSVAWFVMLGLFAIDVYRLSRERSLPKSKECRYTWAKLGVVMALIELVYWIFYSGLYLFGSLLVLGK
jgi:hypothetical protein